MAIARSLLLFVLAALAEIGGAWLVWHGWREHRGLWWTAAGIIALGGYGFVATFQPDPHFGRILAAYGGVFVAGSLAWGCWSTDSARTGGISSAQRSAWSVSRSSCTRRGPDPTARSPEVWRLGRCSRFVRRPGVRGGVTSGGAW